MRPADTVKVVAARAAGMRLEVLHVRRLASCALTVRPHPAVAVDAAHAAARRHAQGKIHVDPLPPVVRPQLAVDRSCHVAQRARGLRNRQEAA